MVEGTGVASITTGSQCVYYIYQPKYNAGVNIMFLYIWEPSIRPEHKLWMTVNSIQ